MATASVRRHEALRIGQTVRKLPKGHEAQVTALTATHAVLHWPAYEQDPKHAEQTYVRLERFNRAKEWKLG